MEYKNPFGTLELISLLTALKGVKEPIRGAANGWEYYCIRDKDADGVGSWKARELDWFFNHFDRIVRPENLPDPIVHNPMTVPPMVFGADPVPFLGWVVMRLLEALVFEEDKPLGALIHSPRYTLDILEEKITHEMLNGTAHTRALTKPSESERLAFASSLTLGFSPFQREAGPSVALGAGLRRRTAYWTTSDDDGLKTFLDTHIFMPIAAVSETFDALDGPNVMPDPINRVQMGFYLHRDGKPLFTQDNQAYLAVRLNASFAVETEAGEGVFRGKRVTLELKREGEQSFRVVDPNGQDPLMKTLLKVKGVQQLLAAPMGPITVQQYDSNMRGAKDHLKRLIAFQLKKSVRDVALSAKELKAVGLTKGVFEKFVDSFRDGIQASPDDPQVDANSGQYPSGRVLQHLGLLDIEDDKYVLAKREGLDFWAGMGELLKTLDGFPFYNRGLKRDTRDEDGDEPSDSESSVDADIEQEDDEVPLNYNGGWDDEESSDAYSEDEYDDFWDNDFDFLIDSEEEDDGWLDSFDDEGGDEDSEGEPPSDDPFTGKKKKSYPTLASVQLAVQDHLGDAATKLVGLRAMGSHLPLKKGHETDEKKPPREAEVLLHLGHYLSGETLAENWISRLLPGKLPPRLALPGLLITPLALALTRDQNGQVKGIKPRFGFRADLNSIGLDVMGANKSGLLGNKNFSLAGVKVRTLVSVDAIDPEQVGGRFGLGIELSGIKLSFAPKEGHEPATVAGMLQSVVPFGGLLFGSPKDVAPDPDRPELQTRLSEEVKGKFSLKFGFLYDHHADVKLHGDIQLLNKKGESGKEVQIPIERQLGPIFIKSFALALKGFDRLGPDKDWEADASSVSMTLTGGIRFSAFELGLIGAGVRLNIHEWRPEVLLRGLDVSLAVGGVVISGAFLKDKDIYSGLLRIKLPSLSIAAMGAYGQVKADEDEGDDKRYTTLFAYGAFNAEGGAGISILGVVKITGLALGFGVNRAVKIPAVHKVASFPFVQMVMGKTKVLDPEDSGEERTVIAGDPRTEVSEPADVLKLLEKLKKDLPVKQGANFGAIGIRATLFENIDAFLLAVLQISSDLSDVNVDLLGMARLKLPNASEDGEKMTPICYLELQVAAGIRPKEGMGRVEGRLSPNSWVLNKDCRITGGFAVYFWFKGAHAGDFVASIGGYHPNFRRPDHYPMVPPLAVSWRVNPQLYMKGSLYAALTSSCFMAGGRLEASYQGDAVKADFDAYLHLLMSWRPVWFEFRAGIYVNVTFNFIKEWDVKIGTELEVWGPPFGGVFKVDIKVAVVDVAFGKARDAGRRLIGSWPEFGRNYIDTVEQVVDGAVEKADPSDGSRTNRWRVPSLRDPVLSGPSALSTRLLDGGNDTNDGSPWQVRGDQLQIALDGAVPAQRFVFAEAVLAGRDDVEPVLGKANSSTTRTLLKPIAMTEQRVQTGARVRVRPMDLDISSHVHVAVVREDGGCLDLTHWRDKPNKEALPGALWDPEAGPEVKPEAKRVAGCLIGLESLQPPIGGVSGAIGAEAESGTLDHVHNPERTLGDPTTRALKRAPLAAMQSEPVPENKGGWGSDWSRFKPKRRTS